MEEPTTAEILKQQAGHRRKVAESLRNGAGVWGRVETIAAGPRPEEDGPDGYDGRVMVITFGEWSDLHNWLLAQHFDPDLVQLDWEGAILLARPSVRVTAVRSLGPLDSRPVAPTP